MAKSMRCPNCDGPLQAPPDQPAVTCGYCGYQTKNRLYRRPKKPKPKPQPEPDPRLQRPGRRRLKQNRRGMLLFSLLVPLLVGGVVIAITASRLGNKGGEIERSIKRALSSVRGVSPRGAASAAGPDLAEADRVLAAKLEAYGSCLERHDSRVRQSRARYLRWVRDDAKGPTCRERRISYGLYELYDLQDCRDAVTRARQLTPLVPELERAANVYLAALEQLHPLVHKAHRYYSQRDYLHDKCAGARTMHPQLMSGFTTVLRAGRELRATLGARRLQLLQRQRSHVQSRFGPGLRLLFVDVLLAAEQMMPALRARAAAGSAAPAGKQASSAGESAPPSDEELAQLVLGYAKVANALDDALQAKGKRRTRISGLSTFNSRAQRLSVAAKARLHSRSHARRTRRRSWRRRRTRRRLEQAYDGFRRTARRVNFR